ncbi:hypothetical protein EON81_09340 [bacterium]|nr:MAG: hypothetical protein EON81_09340 [bacterium]
MAGRKLKFTPEKADKVIDALQKGNTRRAACAAVAISEDTFARWLKDSDFAERVTCAEATAELAYVDIVMEAGKREVIKTKIKQLPGKDGKPGETIKEITKTIEVDAGAAKFWLARRRPADWASSREDLSGADSGQTELDKVIAGLAKRIGARPLPMEDGDVDVL